MIGDVMSCPVQTCGCMSILKCMITSYVGDNSCLWSVWWVDELGLTHFVTGDREQVHKRLLKIGLY